MRRATATCAAAAVVAVVALVAAIGAARAGDRDVRTGFDHIVHEGRVAVTGHDPIACRDCHAMTAAGALVGRPDHRACFGACHGPAPTKKATAAQVEAPQCTACHAPAALAAERKPKAAAPPYRLDPDYGLALDHARHAAVGCASCHAVPEAATPAARATPRATPGGPTATTPAATATGPAAATPAARAAPPHARCASCHAAQAAPAMTACGACHPAAYGANARPRLTRGELAVGDAYDHRRHRARTPGAAALACEQCHAAIAAVSGFELTAPAKATCTAAGCHDGAAAFATTAQCARCHTRAPAGPFAVARPAARFSHTEHAARTPLDACGSCHPLDRNGEARAPGHDACTACHAADFAARSPTTCGACHLATEPWRALTADQLPAPRSEMGASLSHAAHATLACASCHRLDTATRELRPPRGHVACTGVGCHQAAAGPAPRLDACVACHALGLEARRDAARTSAPWSVRSRFRHAPHRADATAPDGALACTRCHDQIERATTLDAIAPPGKPSCAPCHDGARAFKMSGHGCARCHGR